MRKAIQFGLAGMLSLGLLTAAPAAFASGGDGVRASGKCSASSTWKLKAKHDDRRIQWEFEVDQNKVGDTWNVLVTDNGTTVFEGQKVTKGASGSFTVEKRSPNQKGADMFEASATNQSTGETCMGSVTLGR
jgi:hypothetical protein